jgi:hypothetical protein
MRASGSRNRSVCLFLSCGLLLLLRLGADASHDVDRRVFHVDCGSSTLAAAASPVVAFLGLPGINALVNNLNDENMECCCHDDRNILKELRRAVELSTLICH